MCRKGKRRIAVLTSGGDAPGMNAAVRAVTRTAIDNGMEVVGVYRGYNGLLHNDDVKILGLRDVSDIINSGGTMLFTARSPEFNTPAGVKKAADYCKKHNIEGVVAIGGDGTFRGARDLTAAGIKCVCIPVTIDNDVSSSDYTIGFDTAMNTAMRMVDNIRDTAQSHDRCSVVEVMGRHAGYLALHTGIACGASSILVPEIEFDIQKDIIDRIIKEKADKKQHFIIIVAEGVGLDRNEQRPYVERLAEIIQNSTGIESRHTILGHVQRGGSPTVRDRVLATSMGNYAANLLNDNIGNRVVVIKDDKITDYDINEALEMKKEFPRNLYDMAHVVSQ